jgi:hypothetical protein
VAGEWGQGNGNREEKAKRKGRMGKGKTIHQNVVGLWIILPLFILPDSSLFFAERTEFPRKTAIPNM